MRKDILYRRIQELYEVFLNYTHEHYIDVLGSECRDNRQRQIAELMGEYREWREGNKPVKIALVGQFSSGKSSVINSLIGEEILPAGDMPMTAIPTFFQYGFEERIVMEYKDGRQEEITSKQFSQIKHSGIVPPNLSLLRLYYPSPGLLHMVLIDTPGFSTAEHRSDDESTRRIMDNEADVVIWVVDAQHGVLKKDAVDELSRFRAVKNNSDAALLILVNKMDTVGRPNGAKCKKILESIEKSGGFNTGSMLGIGARIYQSSLTNNTSNGDGRVVPYSAMKVLKPDSEPELAEIWQGCKIQLMNFVSSARSNAHKYQEFSLEMRLESARIELNTDVEKIKANLLRLLRNTENEYALRAYFLTERANKVMNKYEEIEQNIFKNMIRSDLVRLYLKIVKVNGFINDDYIIMPSDVDSRTRINKLSNLAGDLRAKIDKETDWLEKMMQEIDFNEDVVLMWRALNHFLKLEIINGIGVAIQRTDQVREDYYFCWVESKSEHRSIESFNAEHFDEFYKRSMFDSIFSRIGYAFQYAYSLFLELWNIEFNKRTKELMRAINKMEKAEAILQK